MQGPDGSAPQSGRPQGGREENAPDRNTRQRPEPSGAPGRMPGTNPFDTGPARSGENAANDRSSTQDSGESGTYSQAEQNVKMGIDMLKEGKYDQALQNFQEAEKADPKEPNAYFYEGIVYRQLGKYDEAIDAFTIAASLTTDDLEALAETYLRRGIVWFYKGEYGIAWDDFDEAAFNCADNDPRPDLWKGLARAKQNRWLQAVNSFAESLAHNDHFAPAYVNRGWRIWHSTSPKKRSRILNRPSAKSRATPPAMPNEPWPLSGSAGVARRLIRTVRPPGSIQAKPKRIRTCQGAKRATIHRLDKIKQKQTSSIPTSSKRSKTAG